MVTRVQTYHSAQEKTEELAQGYVQTHHAPHRYLAYKAIPNFIRKFVNGKRALDYGAGTGASSDFLYELGFDVTGTDISNNMLEKARANYPYIQFHRTDNSTPVEGFDLVFSSFVLFEFSSKKKIIEYLNKAFCSLKKNGIFIGITGSEHLYSLFRKWFTFDANFEENHKLVSGALAKLALKFPRMEFYDYYWKEADYLECFKEANLQVLQVYYPCGSLEDPYPWQDELSYSPFAIFVAKKT